MQKLKIINQKPLKSKSGKVQNKLLMDQGQQE